MNEITSYVQPEKSDKIYACGYRWKDATTENPVKTSASMFKMDENGKVLFLYMFGIRNEDNEDVCRGIDYDKDNREIVMILETTSSSLRPDYNLYSTYSAKNKDLLIITMKTDGRMLDAFNVNMNDAAVSLHVGDDSMFAYGSHYVFGGQSWGYKTIY